MESAVAEREVVRGDDAVAPLEMILCTEELTDRPSRPSDYETENRALSALFKALANSPRTVLQTLAEIILETLNAGSAGVSLLTTEDGGKRFYWPAIAGTWKPHIGGGTPRDFGPSGDVLDRNAPLLMRHIERRYTYFLSVTPLVEECLLVPFHIDGRAVGTIWAVSHNEERKFDAEDLRQLESLGRFASVAYQARDFLGAAEKHEDALDQKETQLARRMAELQQATVESRQARSAALNLMQDAVTSRQAVEKLNVELRGSEQRYRTLFDLGPVAVYSIDASGVIQNFNCRAAELWGCQPASGDTEERFYGSIKLFRPDGSLMPHEDCPMAEVISGRIAAANDAEVIIERPDGSRVTVIVNIRPIKNERGQITGAIDCFYDITERKRVEALQQRDLDDSRRLQEISSHLIHQDDIQMLYEQIVDAARGIMGSDFASFQILHPERGPVGELRLIAFRGYSAEAAAAWEWIRTDTQTTCGMALRTGHRAIVSDIETCQWLAGTENLVLYRQVGIRALQSTPLVSRSGKRLGMISTCWKNVHEPSERDFRLFDVLARQAADLIERRHAEAALRRAHEIITNEAAHLDALVQERTAKLQETIDELEHFSYTITHDMRAPLRAMQGFAGLLSSEICDKLSPAADDYLRRITAAASRMDALICDSLQYAKVVRERTPLTCVHPAPVLRGILDSYPALQPRHVEIQLVEPFPSVMANEAGLVQCFSNLLVNAVKFVKPGVAPKIRIWAEVRHLSSSDSCNSPGRSSLQVGPYIPPSNNSRVQESIPPEGEGHHGSSIKQQAAHQSTAASVQRTASSCCVRFWFEDNGIGIPQQYHERIFSMFQQLDKSYEGTGIGLALVRKTAERMNGSVGVESEPGKGSRFWLEFQAAP